MDSDDDFDFDSLNIDISSSSTRKKNNNNYNKNYKNNITSTSTVHKKISEPKKPINITENITEDEPSVYNIFLNLASWLFSPYEQKNTNENEIVFIKGLATKKAEKDSYKLVNPDLEGNVIYINLEGDLHRDENDGPAIIYPNGSNTYYFYGLKRRNEQNGPAETIFNSDGSNIQKYYEYDVLSRRMGPAVIYSNGSYQYYKYGELHNENGPASHMLIKGTNKFEDEYWINGKKLSTLQSTIFNIRKKFLKNTTENISFNTSKI